MNIRTIIVDDDIMARASLEHACAKFKEIEIIKICENGEEALSILAKEQIDLVFLDVEMPGISGLDLLEQMTCMPQIVMTTGNKDYAYDALEYDVSDFLVKPFSIPRFQKAIEKVVNDHSKQCEVLNSSIERELYVKSEGRLTRVAYEDILYFENVGDYVKVRTTKDSHVIPISRAHKPILLKSINII